MVNAYGLAEDVRIVNRADLYNDSEAPSSGEEAESSDLEMKGSGDLLRQLHDVLETSLDTSPLHQTYASHSSANTLDEVGEESIADGLRKSGKKKKLDKKLLEDPEEVAFRLLPGVPTRISLTATQHRGHALVRPSEDTVTGRAERTARAQTAGVVVNFNDIVKQGQAMRFKPNKLEVVRMRAEADNPLSVIMVTERPLLPVPVDVSKQHLGAPTLRPPAPTVFCPIVQLLPADQMLSPKPSQRRRRRPRAQVRSHPPSTFFHTKHGGRGYALGWPSSSTSTSPETRGRYQRDEMRRGAYATPFIPAIPPRRRSRRGHERWSYTNEVTDNEGDGDCIVSSRDKVVNEEWEDDVDRSLAFFSGPGGPPAFGQESREDGDEEDPEVGWGGDWVTPGSAVTAPLGEDEDVKTRVAFFAEGVVRSEKRRSRRTSNKDG